MSYSNQGQFISGKTAKEPARYSPPSPKAPLWLEGQGWWMVVLAAWDCYWPLLLLWNYIERKYL